MDVHESSDDAADCDGHEGVEETESDWKHNQDLKELVHLLLHY